MDIAGEVVVVRGPQELFARAAHLWVGAAEVAVAACDPQTWAPPSVAPPIEHGDGPKVRKLYRPAALLDPHATRHLRAAAAAGAAVRISNDELTETIIVDRRAVILAGSAAEHPRSYSVISTPDVVAGVAALFEAAWRAGTDLAVYDARLAELRPLAPRILDLLNSGRKDEAAARELGLGLRTYRRHVAELMAALGAESRFQAGVRAREVGLV